jgi:ribosomal protein S18 acetylase RimI-like enzyme
MRQAPELKLRVDERESAYDWFNIDRGSVRIGKLRSHVEEARLTIYSITIFPEFQGRGYGEAIIEMFKERFDVIVADRVRPKARGFWEHEGFASDGEGDYVYVRQDRDRAA